MINHFAANLKKLRKAKKISTTRLAMSLRFGRGRVSSWEYGTEPRYDHLIMVADYFKVTIDQLLKTEI